MKTVCSVGETVSGYDVSHYQQDLTIHAKMAAQGKKFCMIKAEEGVVMDDMLAKHHATAKAAGMLLGYYDFFHPSINAIAQANKILSIIGPLGAGDIGFVIDWETTDGAPAFADMNDGLAYLTAIQSACGKAPIIYGGPYFLQALALDSRFLAFPLWVAHYGVACPLVPAPWTYWTFWQFSGSGGLDQNLFNGSLAQLEKFAG